MPFTEALAMMTVTLSFIVGLVIVFRTGFDHLRRARTERLQAELYNKMLDKFGTSPEFLAWLQSEGGQGLLKAAEQPRPAIASRILNSAQFGLFGVILGIGILITAAQFLTGADRQTAGIIGALVLTAGIGLLAGGEFAIAQSRRFGLLNGDKR